MLSKLALAESAEQRLAPLKRKQRANDVLVHEIFVSLRAHSRPALTWS